MYQFSLNLNSLQQKFSLTSNYFETISVVVKRIDCILIRWFSNLPVFASKLVKVCFCMYVINNNISHVGGLSAYHKEAIPKWYSNLPVFASSQKDTTSNL